ncbi:MAG: PAS domain S-box protein [Candidatus Lindowbacteria bacterium]|nr:PAS domain S-box protein [Candidatus Lindowbacteria bacterium]
MAGPELANFLSEKFNKSFNSGGDLRFERDFYVDGTVLTWSISLNPIFDDRGKAVKLVAVARDATETRKSRQQLTRFYEAICCSADGLLITDCNGNILFANPVLERMTGYLSGELLGKQASLLAPSEGDDYGRVVSSLKGGKSFKVEVRALRKDGSLLPTEVTAAIVQDDEERRIGVVVAIRDIAERKQMEHALRESEERYRLLFESVNDVVYTLDRDYRITTITPSVEAVGGYKPEEIIGRRIDELDLVPPEYQEQALRRTTQSLAGLPTPPIEYEFIAKDGTKKFVEVNAAPIYKDGEIIGSIDVVRDITDRKRAERALKESEERYRELVEAVNEIFFEMDNSGRFTYISHQMFDVTGFSESELLGRNAFDFIHPDDLAEATEAFKRAFDESGKAVKFDCRALTKSGEYKWFALLFDITEQKLAEQELLETKNYLQNLMNNANDVIFTQDLEGQLTFVNRKGLDILGYNVEEWIGIDPHVLMPSEEAQKGLARRERVLSGIPQSYETRMWHKSDGARILSVNEVPIDKAGKIAGTFGIARDITRQKRLESELEKSRMEAHLLSKRLIEAQEEERRRIARDLHDELGQFVTSVKMNVDALLKFMDVHVPEVDKIAHSVHRTLGATMSTIRRISSALRPNVLDDLGLVAAIEAHLEQFAETTHITCQWKCHLESEEHFEAAVETCLYRILQEALNNVVRHAAASRVKVELFRQDESLAMIIEDNGCGFDISKMGAGQTLGVIGMRERAGLVGGAVGIQSIPGAGTRVEVEVPIRKEVRENDPGDGG